MVFIIDIPSDYTKNGASESDLRYFLVNAHEIYNFLYVLGRSITEPEGSRFRKIRKLVILNADKNLNSKEFTKVLADYSPDPRAYGELLEEKDIIKFPAADKLTDKFIKSRIKDVFQNAEVLNQNGSSKDKLTEQLCENNSEFLFYLPICNEPSKELIRSLNTNKQELYLYSDSESMKCRSFTGLKEIKATRYLEVESKLTEARNLLSQMEPDLFEVRNQTPPGLFEALGESFGATIKRIKEKEIKHIVIQGQDQFLTHQIANALISSETPLFFDLSRGLPYFDKDISSSVVLLNLHKLQDNPNKKKLFDLIKAVDKAGDFVILQCNDSSWEKYFFGYEKILLHLESELQARATSLFTSLLMYNNLFNGFLYKLFLIAKTDCLNGVIPKVKSITSLNNIIKNLLPVSDADLLENIAFWCGIEMEAEASVLNDEANVPEEDEVIPETISFSLEGNDWFITMPGCPPSMIPYNSNIGLKYIIVILQNHNYGQDKEIHIEPLREIVIKYAEGFNRIKNKQAMQDIEDIRKNIQDAIGSLKTDYPRIKEFCDNHIEYAKEYYSFRPKGKQSGKIAKCEIYDPNWKNNLLNK